MIKVLLNMFAVLFPYKDNNNKKYKKKRKRKNKNKF